MHIIFDFDGVLVDSEECHFLAHKTALKQYGVNLSIKDYINFGVAVDNIVFYRNIFGSEIMKEESLRKIKEKKDTLFSEYQFIKGVKGIEKAMQLAKYLNTKGIPISVCSASDRNYIEGTLNKLNILSLFEKIIAGDDYNIRNKPHPDIYLKVSEVLGISVKECIAIEDSSNGAKSSIAAGIKTIVIKNEYTKQQKFPKKSIVLDSFDNARTYIDKLIVSEEKI